MKKVTLYLLPNCSTCQKTLRWLDRRGIRVSAIRDIKEDPLSRQEIESLAEMLGGPAELFSKRAVKYREMNLSERVLTNEEMLDLMTEEYTFLKRPVMVIGGKAVAGFFERSFEAFLESNYFDRGIARSTGK
ncbi:MAG: ArsC/Spx/MgsR family protein [Acidobacteriota bacterium]